MSSVNQEPSFLGQFPETAVSVDQVRELIGVGRLRMMFSMLDIYEPLSPTDILPLAAEISERTGTIAHGAMNRHANSFNRVALRVFEHCVATAEGSREPIIQHIDDWFQGRQATRSAVK